MTGEWISYIGPMVALAGLMLTIWWRVEGKIEAASKKAQDALDKLAKHETHAAETFATKAGMHDQTAQLLRAIEAIGSRLDSRLDSMNDRLDRFVENQPARRAPPARA